MGIFDHLPTEVVNRDLMLCQSHVRCSCGSDVAITDEAVERAPSNTVAVATAFLDHEQEVWDASKAAG